MGAGVDGGGMGLTVETITSKRLNLSVEATDTISSLKQHIQRTEGLKPHQQNLYHVRADGRRQLLQNRRTVGASGLGEGSVIELQPRLRGADNDDVAVAAIGCVCLSIFVGCILLGVSFSLVDPLVYGVDFNKNIQSLDFSGGPLLQGRHYLGVGHRLKRFPRKRVIYTPEYMSARTYDGLSCTIGTSMQYSLQKENLKSLYRMYGHSYGNLALVPITRSVLRDIIAKYTAFELVSKRHEVADDMLTTTRAALNDVYLDLHDLELISIIWPDTIIAAITDTAVAVQDVETAKSEYNIAVISAETKVIAAKTLADQLVYQANATAMETLAAAEAKEASILYVAESQANWMSYATTYGMKESETTSSLTLNKTTVSHSWAGTNFTVEELQDYTWLKYVGKTGMAAKTINVEKPSF